MLVDVVAKGGNVPLNVGSDAPSPARAQAEQRRSTARLIAALFHHKKSPGRSRGREPAQEERNATGQPVPTQSTLMSTVASTSRPL